MHVRRITLLAVAALAAGAPLAAADPDRVLFHHGKVFTGDPVAPWAQAVAVQGGTIISVGSSAAVLALATPATRIIDLGGRTLIPGLNDAHVHVLAPETEPLNTPAFVPGPGPTLDEVLQLIADRAAVTPPGTWLFATVGTNVSEDPHADRFTLDAVAPDHPVRLQMWAGHGVYLNTRALAELGIAEDAPDPFGGSYERIPGTSILNGVVHEYAEWRIRRQLFGRLTDDDLVAQYRAYAATAVQLGFTSLQDMAVGLTHARAYAVLRAAQLPVRVRSICFPLTLDESCVSGSDGLVTASGHKWVTDGTPIERLAFLEAPYADRPGSLGHFDLPTEALAQIVADGLTGPPSVKQLLFHSVGDGAIDRVLDGLQATGASWAARRPRVEHGDLTFAPNIARMAALGVVVVQNATHLALTGLFAQRFTPQVFSALEPLRSLIDQGIPLALGTDGIGRVLSPFVDIFLATIHPTHPSEALTVEQAVSAYTRGSAYAEFEESRKGTLAPGQRADLAVLSQDIFTVPPPALPATFSVLTMVDGNIVWDAGVL
jgi:predicted amidohydrolase YtcJ